jgi:hypothetical protein
LILRRFERLDVHGLVPVGASRDVNGHLLVPAQGRAAFASDSREMRETIPAAAVGRDGAKTLAAVEPLYDACAQVCCSLEMQMTGIRGPDVMHDTLFSERSLESYAPADRPLSPVRDILNGALTRMDPQFAATHAPGSANTTAQ